VAPQVHHRHHHAAQVAHAQHMRRRLGEARGRFEAADLLRDHDVDGVLLGTQAQREHFERRCQRQGRTFGR